MFSYFCFKSQVDYGLTCLWEGFKPGSYDWEAALCHTLLAEKMDEYFQECSPNVNIVSIIGRTDKQLPI